MAPIIPRAAVNGPYWTARWMDPSTGRRMGRTLGRRDQMSKRDVQVAVATLQLELNNPERVIPGKPVTISQWRDTIMPRLKGEKASKTVESYEHVFGLLIDRFGDVRMDKVDRRQVAEWYREMADEHESGYTTITYATMARRIWNLAIEEGMLASNPFAQKVKSPQRGTEHGYLSLADLDTIVSRCQSDDYVLAIALARLAGLRHFEIKELSWDRVDFTTSTIHVGYPGQEKTTKRVYRRVPMSPRLREIMLPRQREGQRVIEGSIEARGVWAIADLLGISRWGKPLQSLRANCEQDWMEARHEWTQVARWMGHHPTIAYKHYLGRGSSSQSDDFTRATGQTTPGK